MPTIGETLKNARLKKGASEEAAAKVLKIKVERLKDLEENRFTNFAAPVYVRSFIRNYARYLDLDGKALSEEYSREYPEPERKPIFDNSRDDSHPSTMIRQQPPTKAQGIALTSTGQAVLIAIIVLVLAGSGALYIILQNGATSTEVTPPQNPEINPPANHSTPEGALPETAAPQVQNPNPSSTNSPVVDLFNPHFTTKLDPTLNFKSNSPPPSVPSEPVKLP